MTPGPLTLYRQKSSGAEGERLKEAANINKSLSTLGYLFIFLKKSLVFRYNIHVFLFRILLMIMGMCLLKSCHHGSSGCGTWEAKTYTL